MRSEHGFSLIEVSVALALIGITCVGLISSLGLASKTLRGTDVQETSKDLAEAQMEYVQNQNYDSGHNPPVYQLMPNLSTKYPGFSIVTPMASRLDPKNDGTGNDDGLQQISIAVQHGGTTVLTLTGQKVKW